MVDLATQAIDSQQRVIEIFFTAREISCENFFQISLQSLFSGGKIGIDLFSNSFEYVDQLNVEVAAAVLFKNIHGFF